MSASAKKPVSILDGKKVESTSPENVDNGLALVAARLRPSGPFAATAIGDDVVGIVECVARRIDLRLQSGNTTTTSPQATTATVGDLWRELGDAIADRYDAFEAEEGIVPTEEQQQAARELAVSCGETESYNDARQVALVAEVQGEPHTLLACRARAVLSDPSDIENLQLLGAALDQRARRVRVDATQVLEQRLLRAVGAKLQARNASSALDEHNKDDQDVGGADAHAASASHPALVVENGEETTALQCFTAALNESVSITDAWFFVGNELLRHAKQHPGGSNDKTHQQQHKPTVRIVGKQFAAWQCLVEGLKRDPTGCATAWADLARELPADREDVFVGNSTGRFNRAQCMMQSLALDDSQSEVWLSLGMAMHSGAKDVPTRLRHKDVVFDATLALANAIRLDNQNAAAWTALGSLLDATNARATLLITPTDTTPAQEEEEGDDDDQGEGGASSSSSPPPLKEQELTVDALTCALRSLALDSTEASAWRALAHILERRGTTADVTLGLGTAAAHIVPDVSAFECLKRSVELCPDDGTGWLELAAAMPTGSTVDIAGWARSQHDCLAEACVRDPNDADTWMSLAEALPMGGIVKVGERVVGPHRCYAEAVRCDPQNAAAWSNLGATLVPGGTTTVADQLSGLTQVDCFVRSLQLDGSVPEVWRNVASAMRASQAAVERNGRQAPSVGGAVEEEDGAPPSSSFSLAEDFKAQSAIDLGDGVMRTPEWCDERAAALEQHQQPS